MGSSNSGTGRMFYPVNSGKKDTDVTSDYDDRINEFSNGDAFSSVSVTPQFKTTQLQYENSTTTDSWVNSANFIEIRNTSHSGAISNDNASGIVNRIYPTGTSLTTYGKNGDETNSFKIKVFDSEESYGTTNKKFRYATSDTSETIGLDIDNYDYFILINPQLTVAGSAKIRPHFAKITKITTFDEFGDGLEFEPKYPTSIASQSYFEVYKGPHKVNDTDVVAVSYGLRGDTDVASSKYDVVQRATRPTFYFYNDRLDEDDQLDYCEKYNATSQRWWDYSDELTIDLQSAHTQYANTTTQTFKLTPTNDRHKLVEGQSVFDANDNYIGNIKEKTGTAGQFKIDYSRITLSAYQASNTAVTSIGSHSQSGTVTSGTGSSVYTSTGGNGSGATFTITIVYESNFNVYTIQSVAIAAQGSGYQSGDSLSVSVHGATLTIPVTAVGTDTAKKIKIGKTIQNVVFRTRAKFSDTIPNLGKSKINAVLVDTNRTLDDDTSNSSFDATKWDTAFTRMKRHTSDLLTPTANTIDGNLTGPSKYITFEKAEYKNNKVEPMQNKSLNSPKNRLTKLARISVSDNSGLQHMKIREGDNLKLRNVIHNGKFNKIPIVGKLYTDSGSTLTLKDMTTEMNLKHMLSVNDIVEVDGYYLVINSVGTKGSDTQQSIVIKDYKTLSANTWTGSATAPTIIGKTMYLMPYSGVLNYNFESDSEVKITSAGVFQTVTMGGVAIKKEDSKMYGATLTPLRYNSHMIEVDYADKNNKFAKFKESDIQFYQKTAISPFYYYSGDYSITDEVFSGSVEDIDVSTSNGFTTFKFSGRDDTSKLLGGTISKSLTHHSDVISTSLPPILNYDLVSNVNSSVTNPVNISGKNVTVELTGADPVPSDAFNKYCLLFNNTGDLIGEVNNASCTGGGGEYTCEITLKDQALTTTENNTINTYNPYGSNQTNYITGTKSLQSNVLHSSGISDFTSISEKGLSFKSGLDMVYASNAFTYSPLQLSSNDTSSASTDAQIFGDTLGYDISAPKSISTGDSIFAFTIGNENGVSVTKSDIMTVNSEMFDVINVNEQDYTTPVLEVAPIFPIVLGRVDTNTLDSRGDTKLYLVNNNIATGGFIHRLRNEFDTSGNITSTDIIRYWDLQNVVAGGLTKTHDSIYAVGTKPQAIQGYAIGYSIKPNGSSSTITTTPNNSPKAGSNTLKEWDYLSTFYGNSTLIESHAANSNNTTSETDIMYSAFEQIDHRTTPYELLAVGDIFPASALRHNSMLNTNHAKSFENYGIMLESKSGKINNTTHQLYDGMSHQTLKRNNNFETQPITSSNKTTENIRRWGVIRLVEATFDWHFNPINFETLPPSSQIPTLKYFDYVMMRKPANPVSNLTLSTSGGAATGTLTSASWFDEGDVIYTIEKIGTNSSESRSDLGSGLINNENGFTVVKQEDGDIEVNDNYADNTSIFGTSATLLRFEGTDSGKIHGVENFRLFHAPDLTLDTLESNTDNSFTISRLQGHKNIRFHTCWMLHPPVSTGVFSHQLLKRSNAHYDPMNIILPLIAENKGSGASSSDTDKRDWRFSPFHQIDGWNDDSVQDITTDHNIPRLHMSRVVSAMITNSFDTNMGITQADEESLGIGRTHVYDNCIGLFKDSVSSGRSSRTTYGWPEEIPLTSSPLGYDNYNTDYFGANYESYASDYETNALLEQHSPVTRVLDWTNDEVTSHNTGNNSAESLTTVSYKASLLGTKTTVYPFDRIGKGTKAHRTNTYRDTNHVGDVVVGNVNYSNYGKMYSSQFIVKPTFDLTSVTNTLAHSNGGKTLTFTLNDASTHTWLSFMPELKGYYLVSEKFVDGGSIASSTHHGVAKYIGKITEHNISVVPSTSAYETHEIKLDTAISIGNNGDKYRLMRISETTFDKTPDYIEFNVMHDMGLKYDTSITDFRKGEGNREATGSQKKFQEAVYSMYLKLDVDNSIVSDNTFIESRTTTSALRGFTDGEIIDVHVTDGTNNQRTSFTISNTRKLKTTDATEPCLVMSFEGDLTANGVVSFGEVLDISIGKKPKLQNIKRCYIGTTYDIGSDIDAELSNIIQESGLKYDERKSTVIYTTNIVNTNGTNNIVCLENVTGLNAGDVIYSEDGHLIGEILSITNQTITFAAGTKYYSPPQHSTITKYNKKTFVSNLTFNSFDVYSAINSLTQKKGLDYRIEGNKVILRNLEDTSSIKRKKIDFEHLTGHEPIKNNTSLFDKINRVIVIGDGVRYEMDSLDVKNMKTMTVNDSTITTEEEAQIETMKLLELHSGKARKITLQIQREGFELLEAGDIVTLDFPTYNIPLGNYIVFEIENVLGPILTLTVGSYSKGIAERLNEISQGSKQNINHLLSTDSSGTVGGKMVFDNLKIKMDSIEYKVVGETMNANMGFDDVFGFTETVGFETTSTGVIAIKKEYKDRFYD